MVGQTFLSVGDLLRVCRDAPVVRLMEECNARLPIQPQIVGVKVLRRPVCTRKDLGCIFALTNIQDYAILVFEVTSRLQRISLYSVICR